jgi:hypothetical protein
MTAKHWSVWSLSPDGKYWLEVVEQMTMRDALANATRKREIAAKHGLADAQFVALPQGQVPTDAPEYRTKSGKVLTEADVQALADEAERLRRRRAGPTVKTAA